MPRRFTLLLATLVALLFGTPTVAGESFAASSAHTSSTTKAAKTTSTTTTRLPVAQLKIMNYYPADDGWSLMWTAYSHTRTAADFHSIASLGANTIRVIVPTPTFGYPTPSATMLANFRDMLSTAQAQGLSVQLTLFDYFSSYTDIAGSELWLRNLLAGQSGNPTIALVELRNELPTTDTGAVAWAQTLLPYLSTLLPGVPRTVSASGSSGITGITGALSDFGVGMMDVADVHYYGDPAGAATTIRAAQAAAGGRPVVVGEAGLSTTDGAAGEEAQARFYRVLERTTSALGLPPAAPWIFSDFTSTAIPHTASAAEYHYGLRRLDGTWKPAAAVVKAAFAGQASNDWDGGFEREVNNGGARTGSWSPFDAADGVGVVSTDVVRSGLASLCFSGTTSRPGAVPASLQSFPVLTAGQVFSVSTYVDRFAPTGGERVSLAWFDSSGHYLSQVESPWANTAGTWQLLQVSAAAPSAAAAVQVNLKASNEAGRACFDDTTIAW